MDTNPPVIREEMLLDEILDIFTKTDSLYYPVVDTQMTVKGIITIPAIRDTFACQNVANWLLAIDIAQPVIDKTTPHTPLAEALEYMEKYELEYLPVCIEDNKLIGVINARAVNRKISAEIIKNHEQADEIAVTAV